MWTHLSPIEAGGAGKSLPELADDFFLIWLALARPCCLGGPDIVFLSFSCGFRYRIEAGGAGKSLSELVDDLFLFRLTLARACGDSVFSGFSWGRPCPIEVGGKLGDRLTLARACCLGRPV